MLSISVRIFSILLKSLNDTVDFSVDFSGLGFPDKSFDSLKVRLLRFKADLVKRLCFWDLDILYTKLKLAIFPYQLI